MFENEGTLKAGTCLESVNGDVIEIEKKLAAGGQGEVYLVKFRNKKMALKWYTCSFADENAFYDNLESNVERGVPAPQFLWPLAITKRAYGSFGYVMELIPDGYYEVDLYRTAHVKFSSFKAATEACLQIASAFRVLHLHGYTYQDLSGGNFLIEPSKGNVLICDNDNVAPNGTFTGVLGTPGWMAPEVVTRKTMPSMDSDAFSMAVLIFILLCANHPLEGMKWARIPCITAKDEMKLYGTNPLFIYDPNDNSNAPVSELHTNVLARWDYMPTYLKEVFMKAFSQEALFEPSKRVSELQWLQVLCRFRSTIVCCQNPNCINELFVYDSSNIVCECCGIPYKAQNQLKLPGYEIPLVRGARIYRCQLGTCKLDEALNPIAAIVSKGDELGIRNKSNKIWMAVTPSGKSKKVEPEDVIPVRAGISFKVEDAVLEIK